MDLLWKLEGEGIVSQLHVTEKAFSSPVMFLQKARQKGLKKVVDLRLVEFIC